MKSFLDYFASKMILPNILQNGNLLFKHFVLYIMMISRNDTFLYHRTNQISLRCITLRNAFVEPE